MKKIITIAVSLPVLALVLAYAQPAPAPYPASVPPPPADRMGRYVWVEQTNSLPKFDLNFPGGTPQELVKVIEKATDKPLNTVIPDDCKDLEIPAFSVKNVTVAQLFEALEQTSHKYERFTVLDPRSRSIGGNGSDVYVEETSYGFSTVGEPTENSIWYFHWDRGREQEPWQVLSSTVCRFYQLEPYLEAGYKVDDITTAVETAWKMLGVTNTPAISYHKETKVLIVVGKQEQVDLVGDILNQLSQGKPKGKPTGSHSENSGK